MKEIKISDRERRCLEELVEYYDHDANCIFMTYIAKSTGLTYSQVRRSVRSLARKGLAEYVRGLFDDDGMVAGSGYCATYEGARLIKPCDDCGDVITFDWEDNDGKRHKLCTRCYDKRRK